MSVFAGRVAGMKKLSDFQKPREGEVAVPIDPKLIDYIEQDRSTDNPGMSEAALRELGASMNQDGQVQPAVVRPNPATPGRYIMVAGERRGRAAVLAGIVLYVFIRSLTDDEHRAIQRAENNHREALTQLEIAKALQKDKESLGTLKAVAEAWQRSIPWVSERIGFANDVAAGGIAAEAVKEGATNDPSVVRDLARLEKVDPPAAQEALQAMQTPASNAREIVRSKLAESRQTVQQRPTRQQAHTQAPAQAKAPRPQPAPRAASSQVSLRSWLQHLPADETVIIQRSESGWTLRSSIDYAGKPFESLDVLVAQLTAILSIDPRSVILDVGATS